MPQLSPMMGVTVFTLTNLSFFIIVLSIRGMMNISFLDLPASGKASKAMRIFS